MLGAIIYALTLNAQIVTVKDKANGNLLSDVAFIKYNPKAFAVTNKNGQAELSNFRNSDKIQVILMGYQQIVISYDSLQAVNFQLSLAAIAFSSDVVVVSSSRFAQNAKDIPFKIKSISLESVRLTNPQTAADLLASSGEVFVQKSQLGGGSPMIRGFSTNRLLYSVDGVRMNNAIFRSGNLQNVISLDPLAISNTEVLFGPGSVIYGSDAIGGVMSFSTLSPKLSLTGKQEISGSAVSRLSSANNEYAGHFDINLGWKKWAMLTSITASKYGDLKMGKYGPDDYLRPIYVERIDDLDVVKINPDPRIQTPTGYSQINLMQKIKYQPKSNLHFEYAFHHSETSDYARYDRHIRTKNDLPRYGEWNYGPQKWIMNLLSISHQGTGKFYDDISLKIAHQYFQESRISRDFNASVRETRLEKVNAFSANIDMEKSIGLRNEMFYGVEFVLNSVRSLGVDEDVFTGVESKGAPRYPKSNWRSMGAYITNQYKLTEKLIFQGGLRYSQFIINAEFNNDFYPIPFTTANNNDGALTGSLGAVFRPNKKWILTANLATGYRSPNVDDIGKVFDSAPGLVVVPNPGLKAEYAYNADLSVTKMLGSRLKIDFTSYYTFLNNALVRRNFQLNGSDSIVYAGELSQVQALQNASFVNVYGFQIGIDLRLGKGLSITSNANFQKGEVETTDGQISPSRHAAPLFGTTNLLYKTGKLLVDLNAYYVSARPYSQMPIEEIEKPYLYASDANGNPYSPSWYTINFKLMYDVSQVLTINAGIENITNQRYRSYSSGISGAGRNFLMSIRLSF